MPAKGPPDAKPGEPAKSEEELRRSLADRARVDQERQRLREASLPEALEAFRAQHAANKSKLKSDLRKATAFTKKVKAGVVERDVTGLLKDIETLNLSMYISEIVAAIVSPEALQRLKTSDIHSVVRICVALHLRYPSFAEGLFPGLVPVATDDSVYSASGGHGSAVLILPSGGEDYSDKELAKRKRIALRFLAELFLCGIFRDGQILVRALRRAYRGTAGLKRDANSASEPSSSQIDQSLLVSFAKMGSEALVGTPRRIKDAEAGLSRQAGPNAALGATAASAAPVHGAGAAAGGGSHSGWDPSEIRGILRSVLGMAHETMARALRDGQRDLAKMMRRFAKDELNHGSLSEEKTARLENAKKSVEKLHSNVAALADALDQDPPAEFQPPDEDEDEEAGMEGEGISLWTGGEGKDSAEFGPFGDDETRSFYLDLPDILFSVPPALLGLSEADAAELKERRSKGAQNDEEEKEEEEEVEEGDEEVEEEGEDVGAGSGDAEGKDDPEVGPGGEAGREERPGLGAGSADDGDEDADEEEFGTFDALEEEAAASTDEDGAKTTTAQKLLSVLTNDLPLCHSREKADVLVRKLIDLQGAANKGFRKRLVAELLAVPRQRMDLLPQYARIAASLSTVSLTVPASTSSALASELRHEFRSLCRRKAQKHLYEVRIRNARYIAELTKFGPKFGAPPALALNSAKLCLQDFNGSNIDVLATLLEHCGRYLLRTKHTSVQAEKIVAAMMKLKSAKSLESHKVAMIENAFYACKPPVGSKGLSAAAVRKGKRLAAMTPVERYIRHLILEKLEDDPEAVEFVLSKLRKLPWDTPLVAQVPSEEEDPSHAVGPDGEGKASEGTSSGEAATADAPASEEAAAARDPKAATPPQPSTPSPPPRLVDVEGTLMHYLLKLRKLSWSGVSAVADLLAGLKKFRERLVIRVADAALEELERAVEGLVYRDPQKHLAMAKLVAELYSFEVFNSQVIFSVLYRLIDKGHEVPTSLKAPQPDDLPAQLTSLQEADRQAAAVARERTAVAAEIQRRIEQRQRSPAKDPGPLEDGPGTVPTRGPEPGSKEEAGEQEPWPEAPPVGQPPLPWWAPADPRVPLEDDPPDDIFRAQLVLVILQTCGSYFIVGVDKKRLLRFLPFFQRYLLSKVRVPVSVEYAALDLLDDLESQLRKIEYKKQARRLEKQIESLGKGTAAGRKKSRELKALSPERLPTPFARLRTWEEAHLAVETLERGEALRAVGQAAASLERRNFLLARDGPSAGAEGGAGAATKEMEEALAPAPDVQYPYAEDEDDEEEEEDGEGDNEDDEGSQDGEDHGSSKGEVEQGADEVAEEEYDEEEEADGEGAALADDENAVVHVAMREKTAEDDDFERALARMMQDTLETSRKSTSARAAAQRGAAALTSVPIGLVRRGQDQPGKDSGDASAASVEDKAPPGFLAGPAVKFQLLQKGKQGKVEAKSLFVPEDTNLAETVAKTRQEELKEKEAIKALVLNYGREVEEQEYWESERYGGRGKKTVVMGDVDGGRAYAKVPLQKIKQRSVPQPQKRASGDQGAAASASAAPRDRNARGRGLDFAGKLWEAD